jgi:hypothetical protein
VIAIPAVVQTVTLVAAFGALVISLWQGRAVVSQSREAAKQTASGLAALQRASYQELVRGGANFTFEALHQDPELLDWFLRSRGFRTGAGVENRKILFLFVRLDLHQANHVAYREGRLAEELWQEWLTTLRLDLAIREFAPVWEVARALYTPGFTSLVDNEIDRQPAVDPLEVARGDG